MCVVWIIIVGIKINMKKIRNPYRNENTGNLVTKKEIFALRNGEEEEPVENVYQNNEFDKNNEDHRKPPERNPFLDQIKADSISQSTSTDWMKQQVEASRTNRMRNTLDLLSKKIRVAQLLNQKGFLMS